MAETITTNQFKNGMHIEVDGIVWRIVEFQHVKPGKGGAFVRTKLKALETGKVVERRSGPARRVPRIITSTNDMQFLYDDGDDVVLMNTETYEQVQLPRDAVADELQLLRRATSCSC